MRMTRTRSERPAGLWAKSLLVKVAFLCHDTFCTLVGEVKAAKTPMNEIIEMNQMLNDWAIQPTKPRTLLEILLKIGQKTRRHPFNVLDKSEKGTAGFLDPVVGGIMGNMLLLSNWFLDRKMGEGFTFTEQHFNTPIVADNNMITAFPGLVPFKIGGKYVAALILRDENNTRVPPPKPGVSGMNAHVTFHGKYPKKCSPIMYRHLYHYKKQPHLYQDNKYSITNHIRNNMVKLKKNISGA
jgi:hypothetical protein